MSDRKIYRAIPMRKDASLVLSKDILSLLNLTGERELFSVTIEDGKLILEPKGSYPEEDDWYWSEEWQKAEREAEEDIRLGRLSPTFDNVKEAIKYLKR